MAHVLSNLDTEWAHLAAAPTTGRALRRWADTHLTLHALRTAPDLIAAVRSGGEQTMRTLLELVQSDDPDRQLAGRLVLQVMMPAIRRHAAQYCRTHGRDAAAASCSAMWEVIGTYPLHRPGNIAANLRFDMAKLYRRDLLEHNDPGHQKRDRATDPHSTDLENIDDRDAHPSMHVVELLIWARAQQLVDTDTAQLLLDRYCPSTTHTPDAATDAAALHGLSPAAMRKRCSRAIAILREAAAAGDLDQLMLS